MTRKAKETEEVEEQDKRDGVEGKLDSSELLVLTGFERGQESGNASSVYRLRTISKNTGTSVCNHMELNSVNNLSEPGSTSSLGASRKECLLADVLSVAL